MGGRGKGWEKEGKEGSKGKGKRREGGKGRGKEGEGRGRTPTAFGQIEPWYTVSHVGAINPARCHQFELSRSKVKVKCRRNLIS